ncbi:MULTISPECIES: Ger(x)C family spore germination protein [Pontibacillus]|uniref:Ger(X)C family spore germination protein n=1 Tax=Pontibacillus chungwhensis TaxID=265426 RepID=A0ABY8V395_9BACI|nr:MULTISPECIES: Ger(x)C family spore germination protein [Pontibacillus]MCD5322187.1 Ger(x)C family spore germination protein [Pontibacillus sp. HN14]WIF99481.1 Ger(x)C family spore germination protein [Pontibacillus chungwhensis]
MKKISMLLLSSFLFINGCSEKSIIEDIQIVQTMGYDYVDEESIQGTAALSVYGQSEAESTVKNVSISTTAHSVNDMKNKLQETSSQPIRNGKIETILYNKKLAERGVYEFIDYFSRDSSIGRNVQLLIVDGNAESLLSASYEIAPTVSMYLRDLIKQNLEQNLPTVNFHEFLYSYYGEGMDPFMPLVQKENGEINLSGLALFEDDRLVDQIGMDDLFIFKMLYESVQNGIYEFTIQEGGESSSEPNSNYIVTEAIGSNVHYEITDATDAPEITIHVKLEGKINEAVSLKKKENSRRLIDHVETHMEEELQEKGLQLLQRIQEKKIDPLRIGDRTRAVTRGWKEEDWKKIYPKATFNLNIDVHITQTGISK